MKRRYLHIAVVSPTSAFPIDMLRFDHCYPHHETDSNAIEATIRHEPPADRIIHVARVTDTPAPPWTKPRWTSFGVNILETSTTPLPT